MPMRDLFNNQGLQDWVPGMMMNIAHDTAKRAQ
jgi:hypothetical protein